MNALPSKSQDEHSAPPEKEEEAEIVKTKKKKKLKGESKGKSRTNHDISQVFKRQKKKGKSKRLSDEVESKAEVKNVIVDAKATVEAVKQKKGKRSKSMHKPTAKEIKAQKSEEGKTYRKSYIDVIKRPASAISESDSGRGSTGISKSHVDTSGGMIKRSMSASSRVVEAKRYGQVLTDAVVGLVDEKLKLASDKNVKLPSKAQLKSQLKVKETHLLLSLNTNNKRSSKKSTVQAKAVPPPPSKTEERKSDIASKTKVLYQHGSKSFHGLAQGYITPKDKYERPNIEEAVKRATEAVAAATDELRSGPTENPRPKTAPNGMYSSQATKIVEASRYHVDLEDVPTIDRPKSANASPSARARANEKKLGTTSYALKTGTIPQSAQRKEIALK